MTLRIDNVHEFRTVINQAGETLVVVDFISSFCQICRSMAPKVERLASELRGETLILKVDVDKSNDDIVNMFKVGVVPTFVFIKKSRILTQFSGDKFGTLKETIDLYK